MIGPIHFQLPRIRSRSTSSGSCSRIYGPRDLEDGFYMAIREDGIRPVLAKIGKIYNRLKIDKKLLDKGFCIGLLDPATNILVSSAVSKGFAAPLPGGGGEEDGDINRRSLDGLVAFLTCLFPYLPVAEALRYLDAADADPVVACVLIIHRRGMHKYDFCSATTVAAVETALRCAAVAAKHPDPQRFVLGWKLLSHGHGLKKFVFDISHHKSGSDSTVLHVLGAVEDAMQMGATSDGPFQLNELSELAFSRLRRPIDRGLLPPARAAIKRMLLTRIYRFYLQALGSLSTDALRTRYHRSMLMGGYCYGPLDPVCNIIVNTVWYEQNFPSNDHFTLDMISTKCLWRIVARSLYGLVSFLCTRCPGLTPDQALQGLHETGCSLQDAGTRQTRRSVGTSVTEAYAAAATAAFHPSPHMQKEFLGSPDAAHRLELASEKLHRQHGRPLSSDDFDLLCVQVASCSSSHPQQEQEPVKLSKSLYTHMSQCRNRFYSQQHRVFSMVKTALEKFNQTAVLKYRLHIICGVNELVAGPEFSLDEEVRGYNPWTPDKYHYSHINFFATSEEFKSGMPILFFAECNNHKGDIDTPWCVPVSPQDPDAEQIRCIYCEIQGNRIVHTADRSFQGHNEFDKVLCGEPLFVGADKECYTNDQLIQENIDAVDWVHAVEHDAIYLNCCADYNDGDEDSTSDIDIDIC